MRGAFLATAVLVVCSIACVIDARPLVASDLEALLIRSIRRKPLCKVCIPGRGLLTRGFLEKRCAPNRRIVRCMRAVFKKLYVPKVEVGLRCSCNDKKPRRGPFVLPPFPPPSILDDFTPPPIPPVEIEESPAETEVPDSLDPLPPSPSSIPEPSPSSVPSVTPPMIPDVPLPSPDGSDPGMETPMQVECDKIQRSGGRGTTMLEVDLRETSGTFAITYMHFGIPDAMEVFYEGELLYTTGGPVSGTGTVEIDYSGSSTTVLVIVSAPIPATAWRILIGCPFAE